MRTVIIVGHEDTESGGRDTGAIGPTGLQEEDVVEAVARQMRALAAAGMGLEFKRQAPGGHSGLVAALRGNPPARLLSLHCNAPSTDKHECHVYYWRGEPDPQRLARSKAFAERIAAAARGAIAEAALVKSFPISRRRSDGSVGDLNSRDHAADGDPGYRAGGTWVHL